MYMFVYMYSLYFVICRIYLTCQIKFQIFNLWNDFICEIMYAHMNFLVMFSSIH